jgi:hypothetical protein
MGVSHYKNISYMKPAAVALHLVLLWWDRVCAVEVHDLQDSG